MKPSMDNVTSDQPKRTSKREDKKSVNLKTKGNLFFQIGLILSLVAVIFLMQVKVGYGKVEERVISDPPFEVITITDYVIDKPIVHVKKEIAKAEPPVKRPPVRAIIDVVDVVPDNTLKKEEGPLVIKVDLPIVKPTKTESPSKPAVDTNKDRNINQVEFVPVFPGCESLGTNEEKKACMSSKINAFISKKFRTDKFDDLGNKEVHKIYVKFKIDALGNVSNVTARAPHKRMQEEGVRIIEKLPKMTPGKMGDTSVPVTYVVPISFRIE